jgi:hypothetical protein
MNAFSTHLFLAFALSASPAMAQSAASEASAASALSVSALPSAAIELVAAGGEFSVVAIRPVGYSLEVVLRSAEFSGEVVVLVSREALQTSALLVGTAVEVVATTTGFLLSAGGVVIAFVPSAIVAEMVHRTEIRR